MLLDNQLGSSSPVEDNFCQFQHLFIVFNSLLRSGGAYNWLLLMAVSCPITNSECLKSEYPINYNSTHWLCAKNSSNLSESPHLLLLMSTKLCVYVCVWLEVHIYHAMHVEVKRQLLVINSLFLPWDPGIKQHRSSSLQSKHLYLLSHFIGPQYTLVKILLKKIKQA